MIKDVTSKWIFDSSDEFAVRNGCFFDVEQGAFAVWWIERFCRLYEGEWAGDPMHLRGRHDESFDCWPIPDEFDLRIAMERHEHFIDGRLSGVPCDWQYFAIMRLFGWQKWSDRWNRNIRRFRKASWWVPKKNKKSPTLAAIGLYLTCGDAEMGQKVAFLAKDGKQAREIAGKHAMEMVNASPELSAECKINLVECRIEHKETKSMCQPFSSSNARTKESKEGFNGSLLVDETHVVDRDFMRRMKRSGISRSEPIHLEVSTAGNNPDGYGKERFDYGADVASGKVETDDLCYIAYHAPQGMKADGLDTNKILELGRLANPAWGHTIGEEEFVADWNESKQKLTDTLDFFMYRLNVWQHAINLWVSADEWEKGRDDYTLGDMEGSVCTIGLDLSRTRDMTAACFAFPEYDSDGLSRIRLWPHFWMTEDYARQHENDATFVQWANSGHLVLTEGNEIDPGAIYSQIREWSYDFDIAGLYYDPYHATILTQMIEQGLRARDGSTIVEPLGIARTPVKQASYEMSLAMDEFESMVKSGRIRHPGNPVLTWQIGNAGLKSSGSYTQIAKPPRDSIKKIDGVVASVMSIVGINCNPQPKESFSCELFTA